ncbi:alpha/beta-hydrolase [Serendipita vermifera]|nr:alpha/beta-hydrolase [Serendipita vermifera]
MEPPIDAPDTSNATKTSTGSPSSALGKLLLLGSSKLFRAGSSVGMPMAQFSGFIENPIPPDQVFSVPSTKSNRSIRVHVHRNKAAAIAFSEGRKTAVHINWHALTGFKGSAWLLPQQGQNVGFIQATLDHPLLADYPLTILDATYALSPENPCPTDTEDARDVFEYVMNNPQKYDTDKISISGFSAGGTVALGVAVGVGADARKNHATSENNESGYQHPIKLVIAFYPLTSWVTDPNEPKPPPQTAQMNAIELFFHGIGLNFVTTAHFSSPASLKLSPEEERQRVEALKRNPVVSPYFADVKDFPKRMVLVTAEKDPLSRKAEELRSRLLREAEEGDVVVEGCCHKNLPHAWDLYVKRAGQVGWNERLGSYDLAIRAIARVGGIDA